MTHSETRWDVVIVGGGAAGVASAASLLKRRPGLSVAIVEPSDRHYYQPAWTLVGAGCFNQADTCRATASLIPSGAKWIRSRVTELDPAHQRVGLDDGQSLHYRGLIVAPGLELNLGAIEGLESTLGNNGVTSNYIYELAPYTWQCVRELKGGRALFTQPPMPIKCAGAPQKAMYLSCNYWEKQGCLKDIDVHFHNAGAALFGVADFVPPLMRYVERYNAHLNFNSQLIAVDGSQRQAVFRDTDSEGNSHERREHFDLLHVVPPQRAPRFVRDSELANEAGWVAVDEASLQHPQYPTVFSLGDACGASNAKTAAAVRKQAPVVAENLIAALDDKPLTARYEGYGACPLTVEKGKVVLAEFGYQGKLQPSFPLDPTVPRRSMWWLKATAMPHIYFELMLKGREWLVKPARL
ncbi:MAG: FAD/NAD(P)-binding oxidoreductase [Alcanivorax sp.]|nr:FAD/NAD(P)-binding oxidoreductase [Alcanivorax sp.]